MNLVKSIKAAFDSLHNDRRAVKEARGDLSTNIALATVKRHDLEVLWQQMILERDKAGRHDD